MELVKILLTFYNLCYFHSSNANTVNIQLWAVWGGDQYCWTLSLKAIPQICHQKCKRGKCDAAETNPTRNHEVVRVRSLASLRGLRIRHCCELWLWCRRAAVAPIQLLTWELRYAASVALKKKKNEKIKSKTV